MSKKAVIIVGLIAATLAALFLSARFEDREYTTIAIEDGQRIKVSDIGTEVYWDHICISSSQEILNASLAYQGFKPCWNQAQVPLEYLFLTLIDANRACKKLAIKLEEPVFPEYETRCFSKDDAANFYFSKQQGRLTLESGG